MYRVVSFVVLLSLLSPGVCRPQWTDGHQAVADEPWRKGADSFGAMLFLSRNPEGMLRQWAALRPEEAPVIVNVREVGVGESFGAMVSFAPAHESGHSLSALTVEYTVFRPDGTEYAHPPAAVLWDGDGPPDRMVYLGQGYLVITIEPQDPRGTYTVRARVCDQARDSCLILERTLEVVEAVEPFDLGAFMSTYFADPRPQMVNRAIEELGRTKALENRDAMPGTVGFFAVVFNQNPDLLPVWKGTIAMQDSLTRVALEAALTLSPRPQALLSLEEKPFYLNDMIWGAFIASGDSTYVRGLVNHLEFLAERKDLDLFLIGATAAWCLAANAGVYPLVRQILLTMRDEASEPLRTRLSDVLTMSPEEIQARVGQVVREQREKGVW